MHFILAERLFISSILFFFLSFPLSSIHSLYHSPSLSLPPLRLLSLFLIFSPSCLIPSPQPSPLYRTLFPLDSLCKLSGGERSRPRRPSRNTATKAPPHVFSPFHLDVECEDVYLFTFWMWQMYKIQLLIASWRIFI